MTYLGDHWRGKQSLAWSFWINLVALRVTNLYFERFTHRPSSEQSTLAIVLTVAYFAVFQAFVFPWQVVGVIRAGDRYLSAFGSYVTVLATQFGIVLCLFFTVIYVLGAFQSLFADPSKMIINQRKKLPPLLGEYTLTLIDGGTRIHLKGDFKIGITKEMSSLIDQYPGVVFSSNGGRVTEGRGVARLIKQHRLETFVYDVCKSACTTAFIGGTRRILGPLGKLGFHQFALESPSLTPYMDPQAEQRIDLVFYTGQKIGKTFLDKVFQAPHSQIWYPDHRELVAAGVVHFIED